MGKNGQNARIPSQTTRSTKLSYAPIYLARSCGSQIRPSSKNRLAAGSRSLGCQTGAHYAVFKRQGKYFLLPLDG